MVYFCLASRNTRIWGYSTPLSSSMLLVLQGGIDRGWFRMKRAVKDGPPNLGTILAIAQQIAGGMSYLHSRGIIHGDLAGGNVLLTTDPDAPHGFCAKVCFCS